MEPDEPQPETKSEEQCPAKAEPEASKPDGPRWRPAAEPTCCGSGCDDCPF